YCLTVCKDLTISKLIELLSFIAVFFVLLNSLETKKQFKRIILIIISVGFFVSVLGMIKNFVYPFINKNHFAGYMEMVTFMTIGLLLTELDRQKRVIFSFIAIIMIFTLFLSLSRAGLLSFFISLLVMFCLLRLRKTIRKKTVLIVALVIFAFLFMFIAGADPFLTRISTLFNKETISIENRWVIWKDTLKIIYDFPLFGSGLGTFKSIYPMYKTLTGQAVVNQAHNDLLQLISETGILGTGLILWFFWLFFKNIFQIWLFRHHPFAKGITLGGVCAIFSILLHSFFDFNLQIPANSFLFTVLMAVTYGSVFVEHKNENEIAKAHNNT
ncbi:MAG: O-antigen ligase family protein, partial [Candidatus Omnitrophica bacterium]|nr:O-antigen ligase family protein [Candidatus Omnitrophota bacterium]